MVLQSSSFQGAFFFRKWWMLLHGSFTNESHVENEHASSVAYRWNSRIVSYLYESLETEVNLKVTYINSSLFEIHVH